MAFTLVEISLALAVLGVGFLSVIGLMGTGLSQYRHVMDTTVTAQIAQRVINDVQQSDFTQLVDTAAARSAANDRAFSFRAPRIDAPALRYFDDQGSELLPREDGEISDAAQSRAVYQVNVRIRPIAEVPNSELIGTPQLAQVTVEVAHYPTPGQIEIESAPGALQNLFKATAGVPVHTYAVLVGRNE